MQTPSARGASSLTKVKVRTLRTGQVLDKTFRGGDRVDEPNLELRPVQFLYRDGEGFHFMDTQSYDQFRLSPDEAGDIEGDRAVVAALGAPLVDTAPPMKGATAAAQTKPATLETGLVIQVPAYLESDELVLVDTRDARFVSRAK